MKFVTVAITVMIGLVLLQSVESIPWYKGESPKNSVLFEQFEAVSLTDRWENFKHKYGKVYTSNEEEGIRKNLFRESLRKIQQHNNDFQKGLETYEVGINQFSDMDEGEVAAMLNSNLSMNEAEEEDLATYLSPSIPVELPDTVDWRAKGYVTHVKNQGYCGSCWAFSATGTLEGQHFKKTGRLVSLSEQNLVDCSKADKGCKGGIPAHALRYIIANRGIDTEISYPYEHTQKACRFKKSSIGANCSDVVAVTGRSESKLQEAVALKGPVSVAMCVQGSFMSYKRGVYNNPKCCKGLNHAILAVGYGVDRTSGLKYWLVKNSWGVGWGESGYVRMARDAGNQCGIANQAVYPLV